jgi:hypothetical protein
VSLRRIESDEGAILTIPCGNLVPPIAEKKSNVVSDELRLITYLLEVE